MFNKNKKGFTLLEILVVVLIIGILSTIALRVFDRFVERSRAADAENTIGLAAYAQGHQLMRKGRYTNRWTGLDAAPLATYISKVGDYVNEDGTIYMTKGGGMENPRSGFKMYFQEIGNSFFIVADRVNWRYGYTLVRPLPEGRIYCIPSGTKKVDEDFCTEYMEVDDVSQIPADPRIAAADLGDEEEEEYEDY
ncbi:MAG: prepilin-type N-terminal cleavage/methylation domain-containing protein [Elusimicrobiaceae bacterium]|nr:prepilin-type N-terminal cleavage/methylation domain-containing protein [Elusimicrobiaceae bacterium]